MQVQKVSSENHAAKLNLIEMVKDYGRKLTPGSVSNFAHEQDDKSATIILHVRFGNVDDSQSLAKLAERLKAASESVAEDLAAAAPIETSHETDSAQANISQDTSEDEQVESETA